MRWLINKLSQIFNLPEVPKEYKFKLPEHWIFKEDIQKRKKELFKKK